MYPTSQFLLHSLFILQNILLRYGLNHGLHFAMPYNAHDFSYPGNFAINKVKPHCHGKLKHVYVTKFV